VLNDPRAKSLIDYLDALPTGSLSAAYDLIAPEELTSMYLLGFTAADVQGYNLLSRSREIRSGSTGFSASGLGLYDPNGFWGSLPRFASNLPREQELAMSQGALRRTPDNRWGIFVSGAGEFTDVHGDSNATGYRLTTGGLTVGADYRLTEEFALGVAMGYANTRADLTDDGRIDADGARGNLYGVWFDGGWHIEAMAGGGWTIYDTRREALAGKAKGDTDGNELEGLLSGGYDWQAGPWSFGPQVVVQYARVAIDSFKETGSMAPLEIKSQSADALHSQVGAHLIYRAKAGSVVLMPELRASWKHQYLASTATLESQFATGAGNVFDVDGSSLGRDSLVVGAGLSVQWTEDVSTYLNYDTELARSNYGQHTVNLGIRIRL